MVKVMVEPPLTFVSVTVCPALVVPTACAAKVRLVGDKAAAVAVPVIGTVCEPPGALSVMTRFAVRLLIPLGVKVTLMVQLELPESADPQVFDSEKSFGSAPEKPIWLIVNEFGALFLIVTTCGALDVPSTCVGNFNEAGDTVTGTFNSTAITVFGAVGNPPIVTAISGSPSELKSPATRPVGLVPTV